MTGNLPLAEVMYTDAGRIAAGQIVGLPKDDHMLAVAEGNLAFVEHALGRPPAAAALDQDPVCTAPVRPGPREGGRSDLPGRDAPDDREGPRVPARRHAASASCRPQSVGLAADRLAAVTAAPAASVKTQEHLG